jgi:uncharacterized protein (UPF0218 family)
MRVLPEELRDKLREPLGTLVPDEKELLKALKKAKYIVAVGDLVTFTLLKHEIIPVLCIVDFSIERKDYPAAMKEKIQQFGRKHIQVKNPPSSVSDALWDAIASAFETIEQGPFCLEVDGEEDLAALPAIFLAPRDVTIIYGLPNKGVVVVKATEAHKKKVKAILDRM